ncbi:MAG: hypothetical protein WCA31_01375 [Acidimicrobiales bacterium]
MERPRIGRARRGSQRRERAFALVCGATLAVLVLTVGTVAAQGAVPNPCGLAPEGAIAVALGVKHAPAGVLLPVNTSNGVGNYVCDYLVGHVQLEPQIALVAYGQLSPTGPSGSKASHPTGLGSRAVEVVDTASGEQFADVLFVKDGYRVDVNASGPLPAGRVLVLARTIYDRLR